jgi:hypothetical protein
MTKNKKNKVVEMLSPENYIKQKARSLPIHKCTINADWEETGLAQIAVLRKHVNDNYTIGFYLVDLLCLGVKDAFYLFNVPQQEFEESYARQMNQMPLETIPYNLAHNIIHAGLEFADEYGFKPHKTFNSVAKYILEEDTDAIELIDVDCGHKDDGKPVFFRGPDDDEAFVNKVIKQLDKSAGQGNYHFANLGYDDLIDELEVSEEGETFDLSFLDDIDFWLDDIIDDELHKLDEAKKKSSTTFQFKIQIKNVSKPTVWRRVTIPSYFNFILMHHIIQAVFEWEDAHLFQFSDNGFNAKTIIVGMIDEEFDDVSEQLQASEIALSDIFKEKGQKFIYIYDFGDNWEHEIVLEKIIPEQSEFPKLLDGQGACPPEDCGGPWGYENLKTILANPKHKEYQDYMEWLSLYDGETWDPNEFDLEDTQLFLEEMFDRE